jgi:lycopene beta-cyclase
MPHLLILGGGCSGLSLGLRLAEDPGPYTKITILEARSAYTNDRTWCFWRTQQQQPDRFERLISHSWSRMSVQSAQSTALANCSDTPYQMLESGDFYAYATEKIARSSNITLVLDVSVQGEPQQVRGKWQVRIRKETQATKETLEEIESDLLTADVLIDTRPPVLSHRAYCKAPTLWQSFVGQEVTTDRAVFDPTTVDLMNFGLASMVKTENLEKQGGIVFAYILPITPTRALIETTVFGPEPLSADELTARQAQTVARLCQGTDYHVGRMESGILPMGLPSTPASIQASTPGPPTATGYVRVGLMSGAVRPATGYAFQRIQRWADSCATSLRQGNGPCGHTPDPFLTRFMDELFLQVLHAHPTLAPNIFVNLFGRAHTASVIRFLSDQATLADRASIISALPFGLFLKELATRRHSPKTPTKPHTLMQTKIIK